MNNAGFECDIEKVFEQFCELTSREMTKTVKSALKVGGKELVKQTKSNLTRELKHRSINSKYKDKMEDAVRLGKLEEEKGEELSQKVHIMGDRSKGSGTFRARFFEKGTKERRNRRTQSSYGRITPRWYFKNAQNQVFPKLQTIYMAEITKTVNKINNTKI